MDSDKQRYRLLVLGSSQVGKTCFIQRYLHNTYNDRYKETVEDVFSRDFHVRGSVLRLDIYDTNYSYPDMRRISIGSADAFLFIFAVDDVSSFKNVTELLSEVAARREADIDELPIVIAGNKAETLEKKIYVDTVRLWLHNVTAIRKSIPYYETSSKTGDNVVTVFKSLLDQSGFPNRMKVPAEAARRRRAFQQSKAFAFSTCTPSDIQVSPKKVLPRRQSSQITMRCLSAGRYGQSSDDEHTDQTTDKDHKKPGQKRVSRFTRALSINRDKLLLPSLVTTPMVLVQPQASLKGQVKTTLTRHGSLMKKGQPPRMSLKMKPATVDEPDESNCRIS